MAKRIPPHKVEEIYNAADVVEIIGDYLQLKKRGSNYFALSPFSNEKTPSFAVSPSKNIWKDFSSGKGGNAVTFLMEAEGMTYVEALKYIAEKYRIDLDLEEAPEDFERKDRRESLYVLNAFATKFFHDQMMETDTGRDVALAYFRERGILESTVETFQLGYAPDSWDTFSNAALRNQFQEEYLVETGLCFKSDKDGKLLDRFKGRIMFPIHNHLGKVVGFGGRILGKGKMAKYINSPESEIYHKSYVLYGLYHGKSAIRDGDRCILVEGYMDVIALFQAGLKNVVASSGTALTTEQIRLIKRFTKNVLLIYDSDRAGVNAALRGIDLLLEHELSVRVLLLPEGEDPDSFVKTHGKSGFEAYADEHDLDFIDFKLQQLKIELDWSDPQQKTQAIHETAQTLARIPDQVKMAVYLDLAAEKLGISAEVMQKSLNRAIAERARLEKRQEGFRQKQNQLKLEAQGATQEAPAADLEKALVAQENELIRLLLNYPDATFELDGGEVRVAEFLRGQLEDVSFESEVLEQFKQQLFKEYEVKGKIDLNHFLNHPEPEIARTASRLLTIPYEVSINWEKFDIRAPTIDENLAGSINSAVLHFQFHYLKRLMRECKERLRETTDNEEQDSLARKFIKLTEMRRELSEQLGITLHD